MEKKKTRISQAFQGWLLLLVVIAFLTTTAFLWIIQSRLSRENAISLLELNLSDVRQDIIDASDENLLELAGQIAAGEQELRYLDSVLDALSRAASLAEIAEVRQELAASGYIRDTSQKRRKPPASVGPMRFVSSDGFVIAVGRNNVQNDQLTLKTAKGRDIWFHVKDIPGSHVILVTEGEEP